MIPLLAMQFTDDVNWSIFDFVVMGFLLLFFSLGIDITMKKVKNENVKILYVVLTILIFLLIWAELAVGIFGSQFAGD
jgi:Kef-type K+ transport system membrane component KefB